MNKFIITPITDIPKIHTNNINKKFIPNKLINELYSLLIVRFSIYVFIKL